MNQREASTEFSQRSLHRRRPQLLISVRSVQEMEIAVDAAVDIVDWKEPGTGALAPTDPQLWQQAAERWESLENVDSQPSLSAALGEAAEAIQCAALLPKRFDFAKAGPSGCQTEHDLSQLWARVRSRLHDRIELVAVAYADWQEANCLMPERVFQLASELGLRRCLLDTFCKNGRSSIEVLGLTSLRRLYDTTQRFGLWWALAGSIGRHDLAKLYDQEIMPDCFGVRGDVCQNTRQGNLLASRVHLWRDDLEQLANPLLDGK